MLRARHALQQACFGGCCLLWSAACFCTVHAADAHSPLPCHTQATVQLASDQYGNYVIQHVIESGKPHERSAAVAKLSPHIVALSQHKFASNVVEKCLLHSTQAERSAIVAQMLREGTPGEPEPLQALMKCQFGNYVVQKLLEVSMSAAHYQGAAWRCGHPGPRVLPLPPTPAHTP